ncbi:hypothetical protein [Alkalicoccobacillus plakortidis]|uniref:Transposase n=1 Tax=Alkalicoccobacillus plakortidis TaxID=444060 RepID=A0ABT0XIW5_9BACI|nr:hypothetical protein [Alkalicoccobacillus plakortidis]MCM2675149.1 hypothetical protein [Alkalicoccobacillus plakortidis]
MGHLDFLNDAESANVKRLQQRVVESNDERLRKRSITQIILIIERARLRDQCEHCNV